jgi:hypothetical protein
MAAEMSNSNGNGRDKRGRFTAGNEFARDRLPSVEQLARAAEQGTQRLREALFDFETGGITREELREIARRERQIYHDIDEQLKKWERRER